MANTRPQLLIFDYCYLLASLKEKRYFMHYLTIIVSSLLGPIGLDWKELKATLNPTFEWQKAVQAALDTDDSLESVWIVLIL